MENGDEGMLASFTDFRFLAITVGKVFYYVDVTETSLFVRTFSDRGKGILSLRHKQLLENSQVN